MNHIKTETPGYKMYQGIQTSLITVNLVFNMTQEDVKKNFPLFKLQSSRDLAEENTQVEIHKIFMAETEHSNIRSKLFRQILTFSGTCN